MVSPGNGARSDREHQAGETAVMTDAGAGESADAGAVKALVLMKALMQARRTRQRRQHPMTDCSRP